MRPGKTREYKSWNSMWTRCTKPHSINYARYGGRGIVVCERWKDFRAFLDDMGPRPPGTSLDRIDNDKGYEPSNCQWATREQQSANTIQARPITFRGETLSRRAWERRLGLSKSALTDRLAKMTVEEALTLPKHWRGGRKRRAA